MRINTFHVRPNIPKTLEPLEEIANNLWYSWSFPAILLFTRLDYDVWLESNMNPVRTLSSVSQERLEELAADDSFLAALASVHEKLKSYLTGETWYDGRTVGTIAYFSMEYGLDKSLPIYSGGLGVLSGDHLKTASDMGLPLVAVGLLYRQGYFQQYLNADGFQQESYPENDWYSMPVKRSTDDNGKEITIEVPISGKIIFAAVWQVRVGRVTLYLLDTNIPANDEADRAITATLYGGNQETRIRQEIVLGIGGIRALAALGIEPSVYHMNEGHSAFLALERIRMTMKNHSLSFPEALQTVLSSNVFTTHTPVPAGNERFDNELIKRYFEPLASELGLPWDEFMALGRENRYDTNEQFCMTVLALKCSSYRNGVSALHGAVSRTMWKEIWPGLPEEDVPIGHVTNGVHPRTWISHDNLDLLDRYFGPRFYDEPANLELWSRMERISDEELWRTHERRREHLVAFVRDRVRGQLGRRGATSSQLSQAEDLLSPYALTISFARRFATYKRGALLFRDPERLLRLLSDPDRPVQLIFAGKAHPHDGPGKDLIRAISHFSAKPEVRSRIVFIEDYDMNIAKYLTSGSDIWLNTPRRPMEASGTSGMKAAMNGVLNVSILDGWWAEAHDPSLGWPIGNGEEYDDTEIQDEIESKALYDLLERDVVPRFYDRGRDGLPRSWIAMMKASMESIGKRFSSHRMLAEYIDGYYEPASEYSRRLSADGFRGAKELTAYLARLRSAWSSLSVRSIETAGIPDLKVGDILAVHANVELGNLTPEDVVVELHKGRLTSRGGLTEVHRTPMRFEKRNDDGTARYAVDVTCDVSGQRGYSVRIGPSHPLARGHEVPGLICWA
jgi:glycogen phosphorylase